MAKGESSVYEMYYEFEEPIAKMAGHRVLALNRGEKEKILTVKVNAPEEEILSWLKRQVIKKDNTHVLIDTGVSRKRIQEGLNKADLDIKDISAVLVTHEHIDHIKSLGVLSRKDGIPVYTTEGTWDGIFNSSQGL